MRDLSTGSTRYYLLSWWSPCPIKQSQRHKSWPGLGCNRQHDEYDPDQSNFKTLRKLTGCQGGGIRKQMPWERSGCLPMSQSNLSSYQSTPQNMWRAVTLGWKTQQKANMPDFWSGCCVASRQNIALLLLHVARHVCSLFPMLIIVPDAGSLSFTTKSFDHRREFM